MKTEPRLEVISCKVSKREAKLIENAARAEKQTVSDYLRTAALTTACFDGNLDALRYMGAVVLEHVAENIRRLQPELEKQRLLA